MTVIVGYSDNENYVMACDSCVTVNGNIVEKNSSQIT